VIENHFGTKSFPRKEFTIMNQQSKVALVCCSNGQKVEYKGKLHELEQTLTQIGVVPVWSDYIYERESVFSGSPKQRAEALMHFYRDEDIKAIFDISGGDIANEILPYLDFKEIKKSDKLFWGYSDLTTIINAIYTKTGKASVLYQVKNLVYEDSARQIHNFTNSVMQEQHDLFDFQYHFLQKEEMSGVVVGGNIRCLLKLAGTEYWPDMEGKLLLLESLGGTVPQMVTYLSQLKQMGVFSKVAGILLGTFTKMKKDKCCPDIVELVKRYVGETLPIAVTTEIGHGADSKAIVIGKKMKL
jgi:muramoyltetrapeptide carboxypeptidase LdcA involved in peptidoglycan recycling